MRWELQERFDSIEREEQTENDGDHSTNILSNSASVKLSQLII